MTHHPPLRGEPIFRTHITWHVASSGMSQNIDAVLAKDSYAWAREFLTHPRWGPQAQSINNIANLMKKCPDNMSTTWSDEVIRQMDALVGSVYVGVVSTASQTILDGKRAAPLQDEILREMGVDVLFAMQTGRDLPAAIRDEIRDRLWRKLRSMPPLPPWWKFW